MNTSTIIFTLTGALLVVMVSFFSLLFYVKALKRQKRITNQYIQMLLQHRDIFYKEETISILARLTLLKRWYCENGGDLNNFLIYAGDYLKVLVFKQLDGYGLLHVIQKGPGYVDPEIEKVAKDIFAREPQRQKIIDLFEISYSNNNREEKALRSFAEGIQSRYFEKVKLYPHFYERVKYIDKVAV